MIRTLFIASVLLAVIGPAALPPPDPMSATRAPPSGLVASPAEPGAASRAPRAPTAVPPGRSPPARSNGRPPAPAPVPPPVPPAQRWTWPLEPRPAVIRAFDPPASPWGAGHRGVDLTGSSGQAVLAAGSGVVAYAGLVAGRGVVVVGHTGGLRTTYEPVLASVQVGDRVEPGSGLGTLEAATGHCDARPCLHWGLLRGTVYLDPLSLLAHRTEVRLLPLTVPPAPQLPE